MSNEVVCVKLTRKTDPEYFEVNGIEDKDVVYISKAEYEDWLFEKTSWEEDEND